MIRHNKAKCEHMSPKKIIKKFGTIFVCEDCSEFDPFLKFVHNLISKWRRPAPSKRAKINDGPSGLLNSYTVLIGGF